jgi:hypothetical protein
MTVAIANNHKSLRHLKVRYVAVAGAVAIAASALIAASPWHHAAPRPAAAASSVSGTGYGRAAEPRQSVLYIVGSPAEAATLEGAISSDAAMLDAFGEASSLNVLVVDSPEKELLAVESARELMQFAPTFQVVDLRNR